MPKLGIYEVDGALLGVKYIQFYAIADIINTLLCFISDRYESMIKLQKLYVFGLHDQNDLLFV